MIASRLSEVAAVVGGSLVGEDVTVTGAAYYDSRTPSPGGLYVAIVGARSDGHDFAEGAHAVLGSRPTSAPTVVVPDPLAALARLARHQLGLPHAPTVLAMTGSQGKTGTKDYLAAVLRHVHGDDAVVATAANNNNELGVPITVLKAGPRTTHLVVEMGARGVGHIAELCRIAPPRLAAVLNVGSAHLSEFGSREAIAQGKGEIVEALPADGVAVLNADDPLVAAMRPRTRARVLTFGVEGDVRWRDLRTGQLGSTTFELGHAGRWTTVRLAQPGAHQVLNAAAAAALAIGDGADLEAVADALSGAGPASRWRMEVAERADGLVVVNDAYNANPESVRAALEALVSMAGDAASRRRTVAVLGVMLELGPEHDSGHRSVGRAARELGVDVVVVVGSEAAGIAEGAEGTGEAGEAGGAHGPLVVRTEGRDGAVDWVRQNARPEDVVLVKASRGAALELVAEAIMEETTQ